MKSNNIAAGQNLIKIFDLKGETITPIVDESVGLSYTYPLILPHQFQIISLTGNSTVRTFETNVLIKYITFLYTSSAVVGTRQIAVDIQNENGLRLCRFMQAFSITASQAWNVVFSQSTHGYYGALGTTVQNSIIPEIYLPKNYSLKISDISNISANDTMTYGSVCYQNLGGGTN